MISILLNTVFFLVLVVIWIKHRAAYQDWKSTNEYLLNRINVLCEDKARLVRKISGDGTYTYVDNCGNKYDDALEVTYNDIFLIIKRRSGSVAIPRDNNHGYTMTKNIFKEGPENAENT